MVSSQLLLRVCVAHKQMLSPQIAQFELQAVGDVPLPRFEAGAHIDVHLGAGLVRPYSLCNDPAESGRYELGVLREAAGRGGSQAMHALEQGQLLEISAPRNQFALAQPPGHSLLLAGGIGITPLLSMAHALAAAGQPFELHYCARSREQAAFAEQLERMPWADKVQLHLDDGPAAQSLDLASVLSGPAPERHLYTCGPQGFMDAVIAAARQSGWAEARIHREFFKAELPPPAGVGSFEVVLKSTGQVIRVEPDQSVVAALAAHGVQVLTSCEQGVCGTCVTGVLEGEPDHRDMYFTPEEQASNAQFLPCCSRSRSARLVLDL